MNGFELLEDELLLEEADLVAVERQRRAEIARSSGRAARARNRSIAAIASGRKSLEGEAADQSEIGVAVL